MDEVVKTANSTFTKLKSPLSSQDACWAV